MIQRRGNNDVEKDEKTETQLQYRSIGCPDIVDVEVQLAVWSCNACIYCCTPIAYRVQYLPGYSVFYILFSVQTESTEYP